MCICNVSSLNYCLSILFFLSAFFFTHRLPLIEFNCLCSSNDDDSRLWAIFTLSLLLLLLCAATILSLSPSGVCTLCLFATGLTSFFTPTLIVRLHFSTGSLAVYLFILAANTFAFRFVPQLPKGTSVRQLLYIHICSHLHMNYVLHTYVHIVLVCVSVCVERHIWSASSTFC